VHAIQNETEHDDEPHIAPPIIYSQLEVYQSDSKSKKIDLKQSSSQ